MRGIYRAAGVLLALVMLSACALFSPQATPSEADMQATFDAAVAMRVAEISAASMPTAQPATATPLPEATEPPTPSPTPAVESGDSQIAEPSSAPPVDVSTLVEPIGNFELRHDPSPRERGDVRPSLRQMFQHGGGAGER